MNQNSYKSNYHYTQRISRFIELCCQDKIVSVRELAQSLDVSQSYIYFLLRKLRNEIYFTIKAIPHYERVKLKPLSCSLSTRSMLHRDIILKSLAQHDYVTYIAPYCGRDRGVHCSFLAPNGREGEVTTFFEFLLSHGIIEDYVVRPLTTIGNIVMGFEWYDFSEDVWRYNWSSLLDEIIERIDTCEDKSLENLDASTSSSKFDFYDLFILHYLEYDIFTNIGTLAPKVGTTPQNLSYHFKNHTHKLVKLVKPYWVPIPFEYLAPFVLDIAFESEKAFRGFIKSLQRKPIAYLYAPYNRHTSNYPSAILSGLLPHKEFFDFTELLDYLKDYGIVKDYSLYILDIKMSKGKALPYYCYDGSEWHFDLEPCTKEILRLIRQVHKSDIKLAKAIDKSIESR